MKIFVTQMDIDNGEPKNSTRCPIALSLQRRGVYFEEINEGCIVTDGYEDENSEEGMIPLPAKAKNFINNFDALRTVKPFSFKVKI